MGLKAALTKFFNRYFFNSDWRCLNCGCEIFDKNKFCDACEKTLPYNDGYICAHCGRKVIAPENYCSTCKGILTALDGCRSYFNYEKPISTLIKRLKYGNARYLIEYFTDTLSVLYAKNYYNADYITFVPMTEKAKRRRGYNQSELLAKSLSEKIGVPTLECLAKVKETKRQVTLRRSERFKNLIEAFRVADKKAVKGKTLVIVDDVTTTGATAQALAERLKKAGALKVYLLTVASRPPIDKY